MTSCFVARISNPSERFGKPFYEVDVPSPLKSWIDSCLDNFARKGFCSSPPCLLIVVSARPIGLAASIVLSRIFLSAFLKNEVADRKIRDRKMQAMSLKPSRSQFCSWPATNGGEAIWQNHGGQNHGVAIMRVGIRRDESTNVGAGHVRNSQTAPCVPSPGVPKETGIGHTNPPRRTSLPRGRAITNEPQSSTGLPSELCLAEVFGPGSRERDGYVAGNRCHTRDRSNQRQLSEKSPSRFGFITTVVSEWQPNGEFTPFDNCPM